MPSPPTSSSTPPDVARRCPGGCGTWVVGQLPAGPGSVLTHCPSWSVLTLPGDRGTYCVVLVGSARDKRLRALRDSRAWLGAARTSPVAAHWVEHGSPIAAVMPIAGIEDVYRSYLRSTGGSGSTGIGSPK